MNNRKRIFAGVVAVAILIVTTIATPLQHASAAEYWPDSISVASGATYVVDLDTGTVLYEYNADTQYYPASITKVMTALLALENCELDEIVTFSEEAVMKNEADSSHIAREIGEEMTLENCLYALMLESANEVAWAIAEHVGGTEEEFVNMMNERAKELGCTGTHFANPNGLHNPDHYVTAHDMELIAAAAYRIPEFRTMCSTRSYTLPADNKKEEYYLHNTHAMISANRTSRYLYDYAIGGKTGYTEEAGNTLVTFAEKDGMTLCAVILNGANYSHYTDTINLFDYCFQNFSHFTVADYVSISELNDTAATGLLSDKIDLIGIDEDGVIVLPNTASFVEATPTVAPADDTDAIATVTYTYAGRTVGSANILYQSSDTISYPFHNVPAEQGGSDTEYIRIDFKMILWIVVIALAIFLALFYLHTQSGRILGYANRKKNKKKKYAKRYRTIQKSKRKKRRSSRTSSTSGGMRTRANQQRDKDKNTKTIQKTKR